MHLTIPQSELATAVQWAARQLPAQPLYPALMGIRLESAGSQLTVTAFDGDTATRSTLDADIEEAGQVLVSGRLLADVIATLGKTDVALGLEDRHLTVVTADTRIELDLLDGRDYPALPELPAPDGTVDGAELAAAYKKIKDSVDPKAQGTFAGMSGVRMRIDGGHLQLTATDRYRIADTWLPLQVDAGDQAMAVLPNAVLAASIPVLTAGQVQVSLPTRHSGVAALAAGDRHVTTAVIDPDCFPHRVDEVVPTEFTGTAVFDAADAAEALRRVATVIEEGKPAWVRFDSDGATVHGRDRGSATATFHAEYDGDQDVFEAAWNPGWLAQGLAHLQGRIHMQVTTPKNPAVLADPGDDTYRYTVIPIREPHKAG